MIREVRHSLPQDTRAATTVEFALVLPVLLVSLLGLLDLGYNIYTAQMLQGAVQTAARLSTLQGAEQNQLAIDESVTRAVRAVAPNATLSFRRTAYANFSSVARPEDSTDVDGDGVCAKGEPYEDINGNGMWDKDSGTNGFGGACDAVLYTVTVNYTPIFPFLATILKWQGKSNTLSATTVLRNQPYAAQAAQATKMGNCA